MEITQVKIFPVHEEKLKAFVSIVLDHCFMVNDIKVIQGKDGLFLSMPSRRKKSGEFKDVAHPLNNETRRMLEEQVLAEYRREVNDATPRRPDRDLEYPEADTLGLRNAQSAEGRPAGRRPAEGRPAEVRSAEDGRPAESRPTESRPKENRPAEDDPKDRRPAAAAHAPGAGTMASPPVAAAAASEKTLEEVQELHLSDSFWSVS